MSVSFHALFGPRSLNANFLAHSDLGIGNSEAGADPVVVPAPEGVLPEDEDDAVGSGASPSGGSRFLNASSSICCSVSAPSSTPSDVPGIREVISSVAGRLGSLGCLPERAL